MNLLSVVRTLVLMGLVQLSVLTAAYAEPDDLARYELSFCGYRVGMSYDEAEAVRPIQRVDFETTNEPGQPLLVGYVDNLQVEEFDLRFKLHFNNERLFKVIARLPLAQFEALQQSLLIAYGKPEDRSRTFEAYDGSIRRNTAYCWDFPGAQIFLLQASINTEFATASLLARPDAGRSADAPATD